MISFHLLCDAKYWGVLNHTGTQWLSHGTVLKYF